MRLTDCSKVEELKGQEGNELNKLNQVYIEKKNTVRQLETQVSIIRQPYISTERPQRRDH